MWLLVLLPKGAIDLISIQTRIHWITKKHVCNELIFYGMQFPLNKILITFVAHLVTLHLVPSLSKSVNYLSHNESLKIREIYCLASIYFKNVKTAIWLSFQRHNATQIIDWLGCKNYLMKLIRLQILLRFCSKIFCSTKNCRLSNIRSLHMYGVRLMFFFVT